MEFIFELILECALEGCLEASKNIRIPKYIRYPLIIILSLFFVSVIGLVLFAGICVLEEHFIAGMFLILIGLFFLIMSAVKFKKVYLIKAEERKSGNRGFENE